MPCPRCGSINSKVTDSRQSEDSAWAITDLAAKFIRRRRECGQCGYRYSTVEVPVELVDDRMRGIRMEIAKRLIEAAIK